MRYKHELACDIAEYSIQNEPMGNLEVRTALLDSIKAKRDWLSGLITNTELENKRKLFERNPNQSNNYVQDNIRKMTGKLNRSRLLSIAESTTSMHDIDFNILLQLWLQLLVKEEHQRNRIRNISQIISKQYSIQWEFLDESIISAKSLRIALEWLEKKMDNYQRMSKEIECSILSLFRLRIAHLEREKKILLEQLEESLF